MLSIAERVIHPRFTSESRISGNRQGIGLHKGRSGNRNDRKATYEKLKESLK